MPFPWSEDKEEPVGSDPNHTGFCAWILVIPFIGIAAALTFLVT